MTKAFGPRIRAAGFADEWTSRPFDELAIRRQERKQDRSAWSVEYEDIESGFGRVRHDRLEKSTDKLGIAFHSGDVLFGKLRPYLKNWLLPDSEGIAIGDFWVLQPAVTSDFLYSLIQGAAFTAASSLSTGSKMPRSDWQLVAGTKFAVPVSAEEQGVVGQTIVTVEALVNQHRDRLQQLQQTKAALMQRMFPREGASEPEVRFKGFSGAWGQSALGAMGHAVAGSGFPTVEQGGSQGYPFFKVSDMNLPENGSVMRRANNYVTDAQISRRGWHVVESLPAIIFAKVGAAVFLGRKRVAQRPFLMDNNMMAYSLCSGCWDLSFAKVVFDRLDLASLVQVGALPSFNPPAVEAMVVQVPPTIEEQQAIGQFFANLDDLIAAEGQYVAKLQQVKSALLQKMFV